MVGWIQIEGTSIDYPVMQTPADPNYYLKHDFEKHYTLSTCDNITDNGRLLVIAKRIL